MSASFRHFFGGVLNGFDDVHVSGASAKVARDALADLVLRWMRILFEQDHRGHHHSWRAITALQAMLLMETLLNWVQFPILSESFHCTNLRSVGLYSKYRAGFNGLTIED